MPFWIHNQVISKGQNWFIWNVQDKLSNYRLEYTFGFRSQINEFKRVHFAVSSDTSQRNISVSFPLLFFFVSLLVSLSVLVWHFRCFMHKPSTTDAVRIPTNYILYLPSYNFSAITLTCVFLFYMGVFPPLHSMWERQEES